MTSRPHSSAAALLGATAGAIIGPIVLLIAVMIIGELLPFDEATGSAAFGLLFYLLPAASIVGATLGWGLFRPAPPDRSIPHALGRRLPPSRGRTVAASFVGAVLGMIAIEVIVALWRSSAGEAGGQRVYMAILLCGTPAAIILGAIAGARAARHGTDAAPK